MCTGTTLLYRIPRVVVGENVNFAMDFAEKLMRDRGVQVRQRFLVVANVS